MVDIFQTPEKLIELHSMRWTLFVAMLRRFYDGMGMIIEGLALTHADVQSTFNSFDVREAD